MECIRSGLSDYVHYARRILPVLSGVITRLDAELLQRVRHRQRLIRIAQDIFARDAIQIVTDIIGTAPVDRDTNGSWKRFRRTLVGVAESDNRPGHQGRKL